MAEKEFENGEIKEDALYLYECPEHGLFIDFYKPNECPECERRLEPIDEVKIVTLIHITKEAKTIEAVSLKRE